MKFLIVSDREYKKTNRGIDMITTYLGDKDHFIDHLVFFKRTFYPEKHITSNIRQLYFYDTIKIYRSRLQFLFPGFILGAYFHCLIKKQKYIDFSVYDYVILESGHPMYLAKEIQNKIIYRQSDPIYISFNSNRKFYNNLESSVISKSFFVTSALNENFFPNINKEKFSFWHSGFIPYKNTSIKKDKNSICFIGGNIDWKLINTISRKHLNYTFNVIGIPGKKIIKKNLVILGYLDYKDYQETILSSSIIVIPYSKHFSFQLRQTSFTAKILLSMSLGIPILVRSYGIIQKSDFDKKLFVYKTRKEAISLFEEILTKVESGSLSFEVSKETKKFLFPQYYENRMNELDIIFNKIF